MMTEGLILNDALVAVMSTPADGVSVSPLKSGCDGSKTMMDGMIGGCGIRPVLNSSAVSVR